MSARDQAVDTIGADAVHALRRAGLGVHDRAKLSYVLGRSKAERKALRQIARRQIEATGSHPIMAELCVYSDGRVTMVVTDPLGHESKTARAIATMVAEMLRKSKETDHANP